MSTKFDMRSDPGVVRNYGRLLLETVAAVPDGMVCFFVSYSYMDGIVNSWNEMGILQVIIQHYLNELCLIWTCKFGEFVAFVVSLLVVSYTSLCSAFTLVFLSCKCPFNVVSSCHDDKSNKKNVVINFHLIH